MEKIYYFLIVTSLLLSSCGGGSHTSDDRNSEYDSDYSYFLSSYSEGQLDALHAAQVVIKKEFANDAAFEPEGTIIEETQVTNRYKILQKFKSDSKSSPYYIYRIWIQKFPSGWEFGNLQIEDYLSHNVYSSNGKMKAMEQAEMTRTTEGSAGGIDYKIIKRNAPNFALVYTPRRLKKSEILSIYNQLKGEYNQVQFTKSQNPKDDDYLAIDGTYVFEHDKNKVTKLSEY